LVVEVEQGDYVLHIGVRANPAAHPTGVGQNVVRLRSSGGDELVSRRFGKWEVAKMIAVDVVRLTRFNGHSIVGHDRCSERSVHAEQKESIHL